MKFCEISTGEALGNRKYYRNRKNNGRKCAILKTFNGTQISEKTYSCRKE